MLTKDEIDAGAKAIYALWANKPGYVPWVPNGNSTMQDEARRLARVAIAAHTRKVPEDVEPVARLLMWNGPAHQPIPHGGIAARTFTEFDKDTPAKDRYWFEGEALYPASTVAALKSRADALQARVDALEKDGPMVRIGTSRDRASSGAITQAVWMLIKEEPEKCYSLDEETFHDLGDFIDMLDEEQAQPGFLVYEGESDRHTASHYARGAVSDLFERMGEQAFEDAGEHIGDWPDNTVKGDKLAELERLINDWLDANVKVHFYTVKNVRQIALTPEMLSDDDAGRTIPPSGEIGGA